MHMPKTAGSPGAQRAHVQVVRRAALEGALERREEDFDVGHVDRAEVEVWYELGIVILDAVPRPHRLLMSAARVQVLLVRQLDNVRDEIQVVVVLFALKERNAHPRLGKIAADQAFG